MTMHKRSYAELRKLRRREEILLNALDQIDRVSHNKDLVDVVIKTCRLELQESDKKENFLRELELPSGNAGIDADAEEILKKIRERSKQNAAKKPPKNMLEMAFDWIEDYKK